MVLLRLGIFLLMMLQSFAAISALTVFEVRTAGATTNGGGYVTGSSGTDFSQQDAAQCAATDLVLVTTTTATSATCPFGATSVGNLIQITAGANCTTGFYQVVSVSVVTATLDRVAGTVGCVAGTFALGGAINSPVLPCTTMLTGNTMWLKAGTYPVSTTCTISANGVGGTTYISGYTTTRGDGGKATWTTATNSNNLLLYSGAYVGFVVENMTFTNTAGTRAIGFGANGSSNVTVLVINNCVFDGFSNALSLRGDREAVISNTEVKNSTSNGIELGVSGGNVVSVTLNNVYAHNNGAAGAIFSGIGTVNIVNSNLSSNTGDGYNKAVGGTFNESMTIFKDSIFAGNGGDGIEFTSTSIKYPIYLQGNIIYGNTGIGVKMGIAPSYQFVAYNGYGANGTARQNINVGTGDVTLSADPFVSSAGGNYALNSTAGGGTALKAVGFPGVSLFGTGYRDIGSLQHADPTPAPSGAKVGYAF